MEPTARINRCFSDRLWESQRLGIEAANLWTNGGVVSGVGFCAWGMRENSGERGMWRDFLLSGWWHGWMVGSG